MIVESLIGWLPSQCLVCHAWPARIVCAACTARFASQAPRCQRCAQLVPLGIQICGACLTRPPPLDRCVAAVAYQWPWPIYIQRFKFDHDVGLARPLARLIRCGAGARELLDAADWLLPIPSSDERLAERGYNPAALLARELGHGRCRLDVLVRIRHTPPQRALSRTERLRNLRGAFGVAPRHAQRVAGQRVLLVDDVMTTGATLHEAARALRRAGAAGVDAVVVARDD